ncbi:MAG: GspH/FimT family pseudopilin [Desulfotignum sp.]|nr:GspH/FimT family pseudopilin [Desulfotignum sp.]MCF8113569.1 GspH/FimT family pseudopilin [Desulfotignum sp.]MCF8124873.1 GspH/FimT family pseudopilin [Desulfotignum sp.]
MITLTQFRQKTSGQAGITLIELMVVLAIISISTAIAMPGMGTLIQDIRLKSAARALVSDLQMMKLRAIKENTKTTMEASQVGGMYIIFVDKSSGKEIIAQTDLKNGLEIVADAAVGFNGRGFRDPGPDTNANPIFITLSNVAGRNKEIEITPMGHIRVN